MKKTVLFTLFFAVLGFCLSYAQIRVSGTVTSSEDGTPVPFATIIVKGTSTITYTNTDGKFALSNIPGNTVLTISSIGYTTQEVSLNSRSVINITLSPDATALEEIMVVAYGSAKKKDLTASISSLKGEELIKAPVASMDHAMQGKIAGVQINAASGSPGAAVVARIRGAASFSAGNDPLYVVDGIPIASNTEPTSLAFGAVMLNSIASINPGDIENIQVLKDASAAALYGSRASNGVVLITTKSGKNQKIKVSLDAYYGVQNLRKKIEYLGTTEWIAAQNEARVNYNNSYGYDHTNSRYQRPIEPEVSGVSTDWTDEVTRNAPLMSNIQIAVNGGNESTQFYLSAGRFQQEGLVYTDDFLRYSFRTKVDHRFNKRLKISLNTGYSYINKQRVYTDNNIYAVFLNASRLRPDVPVYDPQNPENYYITSIQNPVACYKETDAYDHNHHLTGTFKASWELIDHLTFSAALSADISNIHELRFQTMKAPQASGIGNSADASTYQYNWLVDNTLTYQNIFGPLNLTAMIGQSFNRVDIYKGSATGEGFVSDDLLWIESAATRTGTSSFRNYALESYFGRLNFNVLDRYLIEGSIRSDASSKFAPSKRVGIFPAGSIGWRLSNESFFPKNNVLTDAKIRASMGLTGNQAGIAYFTYMTLYTSTNIRYLGEAGVQPTTSSPSPNLRWEKTLQTDIGVDLAFWNSRIEFTYDYFIKDTRDLLQSHSIPSTTGWTSITENVGRTKNWGHEFSIFSRNVAKNKFQWNSSLNLTFLESEVIEMAKNEKGEYIELGTGFMSRLKVGYPVSTPYVVRALGIYQSDSEVPATLYARGVRAGDVIFEDVNGDGIISSADRQMVPGKSGMPRMFGGLNNTLSFYGFDLGLSLQWAVGQYIYAYWKESSRAGHNGAVLNAIFKPFYTNRWRPENPHNDPYYPRFVYGDAANHNTQTYNERFLFDASNLRVKSLTLGYSLPTQITSKFHVSSIRCYLSAENLWTFTKYDGYDPEVQYSASATMEQGVDMSTIPLLRTFSFGINVSF